LTGGGWHNPGEGKHSQVAEPRSTPQTRVKRSATLGNDSDLNY